ncbi:MAG: BtpA/SgcQ family protein [bacterium]|nr:BtpA/SgcQ family protein [bacterium]
MNRNVFLAVVHVTDYFQALHNVDVAARAGADGAFLISHGNVCGAELIEILRTIKEERKSHGFAPFWLGVNCLDMRGTEVFKKVPPDTEGVWLDDLSIRRHDPGLSRVKKIRYARLRSRWRGLLFGGVAFKYQEAVPLARLAEVTRIAKDFTDVITTSGEETGKPPTVEKIRVMSEAAGGPGLIAVASGMTPENVGAYKPYAKYFLVSTGVSESFTKLDPSRVRAFAKEVGK